METHGTASHRSLLQIVLVMAGQINREMLHNCCILLLLFFPIPLPPPPLFSPPSHSSLVRRSRNSRLQNGGYQPNKQLKNYQFGTHEVSFEITVVVSLTFPVVFFLFISTLIYRETQLKEEICFYPHLFPILNYFRLMDHLTLNISS